MKTFTISSAYDKDWLKMRRALWPDATVREHKAEMASFIAAPDRFAQFISRSSDGKALGFAEASIRYDYVNGTEHTPVAFLEGLFVKREARLRGVAKSLVAAVEQWAKAAGSYELASDTPIRNRTSQAVHKSLGFMETERVVYFNKRLRLRQPYPDCSS